MKVWIVEDYSDYEPVVFGVYSTREKAEAVINGYPHFGFLEEEVDSVGGRWVKLFVCEFPTPSHHNPKIFFEREEWVFSEDENAEVDDKSEITLDGKGHFRGASVKSPQRAKELCEQLMAENGQIAK